MSRHPRSGRVAAWTLPPAALLAVAVIAVIGTGGHGAQRAARATTPGAVKASSTATTAGPPSSSALSTTPRPTAVTPTTVTPTGVTPTTVTRPATVALPPAANGDLPQTPALPSIDTAAFHGEMLLLWRAIRSGDPAPAMAAFFPVAAYDQVKAFGDDAVDWKDRLVAHFDLDVAAAHHVLGPGATAARFVGVVVPTQYTQWIPPGACYNRVGYWNVPGSRLVYREAGVERSMGIASLISWRGYWYVVHLGSEVPPPGQGVVDAPAAGAGVPGPPGGC